MVSRITNASVEFHGDEWAEPAVTRNDPTELLSVPLAVSLHSADIEWAFRSAYPDARRDGACGCVTRRNHRNSPRSPQWMHR
jgi:hypothetical protein